MIGRVTYAQFALVLLLVSSASRAGVLAAPQAVEGAPIISVNYSGPDVSAPAAPAATVHSSTEVPSAPLPPALWPGLAVLVALGSVKFALRARRRGFGI